MANMGYCKFRNTVEDLQDCYDGFDETVEDEDELKARKRLIRLCCDIALEYGYEIRRHLNEE